MHIAFLTGIWPPDVGGPATHGPDFARFLVGRGHTVHVVTMGDGEPAECPCEVEPTQRRLERELSIGEANQGVAKPSAWVTASCREPDTSASQCEYGPGVRTRMAFGAGHQRVHCGLRRGQVTISQLDVDQEGKQRYDTAAARVCPLQGAFKSLASDCTLAARELK